MSVSDKEFWQANRTPKEEEFEDALRSLVALLDDPHPGLHSWHTARLEKEKVISEFLNEGVGKGVGG